MDSTVKRTEIAREIPRQADEHLATLPPTLTMALSEPAGERVDIEI